MQSSKIGLLWILLGLSLSSNGIAETFYYQADVSSAKWSVTGTKERCELTQNLHDYGSIYFLRPAGLPLSLRIHTQQDIKEGLVANINATPPPWLHQKIGYSLASDLALHPGTDILELDPYLSSKATAVLEKGMTIRIQYPFEPASSDQVIVEASTVNFRAAYDEFQKCIDKLLPYDFQSISFLSIYFDIESTELNKGAKETLDKIARYIKAGPTLSKALITGFADRRGRYQYNLKLTRTRSEIVRSYLISQGVDEKMVEIEDTSRRGGYTFSDNLSDAENRRVTVRLIQ